MGTIRKGGAGMARLIWDLEECGTEACPRLALIRPQAPRPIVHLLPSPHRHWGLWNGQSEQQAVGEA